MKDIIPATKQSPILGLAGMGGGVGSNIVAGLAADPTYVDEVFSTYLYKGTGTDQTFNNGIKLGNSNAGFGVGFNGAGNYFTIGPSSDFSFGTGDFTIEFWVKKPDSTQGGFFQISGTAGGFSSSNLGNTIAAAWAGPSWQMYGGGVDANSSGWGSLTANAWYHIAVVKSSNTLKMYVNGTSVMSRSDTNNYSHTYLGINGYYSSTYTNKGTLSNFRVVKGTAVYTGNFTPPTAELTSIANTKLLCCNSSVMTTATVTPGPIGVPEGHAYPSGGPFTASDGEGGMIWSKGRDSSIDFVLLDTERGIDKLMFTNGTWSQEAAAANDKANTFRSFDNNGYTIGTTGYLNNSGTNYTSWTWRKQKGFFDIVTYSGDGSASRDISHNLGCVPGVIIIKRLDVDGGWQVYHRDLPDTANPAWSKILRLDTDAIQQDAYCLGSNTHQTASTIRIGNDNSMNTTGGSYVAYLFAGGASTAATARSVDFDGSGDSLDSNTSSDYDLGTGDFTLEYWFYNDLNAAQLLFDKRTATSGNNACCTYIDNGNYQHKFFAFGNDRIVSKYLPKKQWYHAAIVRSSGSTKMYINGIQEGVTYADTNDYNTETFRIGGDYQNANYYDGKISNLRLVKGTAVYTSPFKPPTKPLASITGTVFLACNNASITGTTTGSLTSNGDPTASTDSPFDDPDGFKFGEDSDENIIKCGSYIGNADTSNGTEVYLGFEPQWLLIKPTGFAEHWHCFDCMRGMTNKVNNGVRGEDYRLEVNNSNNTETTAVDFIDVNSDGFTAYFNANVNGTNGDFVYIAVRRPDGYVGKPTETGTDVFTQAYGKSSGDFRFTSGFPVDFGWAKIFAGSGDWWTSARLIQGGEVKVNTDGAEGGGSNKKFDSSVSWHTSTAASTYISHMWKRGAGFDVVAYKGLNGGKDVAHSLGQTPEMMWFKRRNSSSQEWFVYHKGLNGGSNPEGYNLQLQSTIAQDNSGSAFWYAPTSSHLRLKESGGISNTGGTYLAILFASVDGISKCGYYSGNGSSNLTITTGFQPRFILIKRSDGAGAWHLFDSLRGMGATDKLLQLNSTSAQLDVNYVTVSSTGWNTEGTSLTNGQYIYYAHA